MKHFKMLCEAWDVSNSFDPREFKDSRVRWFDSDNDIRQIRNVAYRLLLCKSLSEAVHVTDMLFNKFSITQPTGSKVLRAIASTLSQSTEQNWKENLRELYRYILK